MSTPCYYCDLPRPAACAACLHGDDGPTVAQVIAWKARDAAPPSPAAGQMQPADEREELKELIADFRLSNWTDHEGDGLPLVDRITSGESIAPGMEQIDLLADEIACFFAERAAPLSPAPQGWREAMQRALQALEEAAHDAVLEAQDNARQLYSERYKPHRLAAADNDVRLVMDSIAELRALLSSPSSIEKAVPLSEEQILYFARHAADRIPASNYEGRVIHAVRMAELAKEPKNG